MNATRSAICQGDLFNPLISMGFQMSSILVLSHLFQLVLKPLGQAGPIAQVLAGLVLGPSALSNIKQVKEFFFQVSAADYYEHVSVLFRIIIVFVMGLEVDISYLRRNLRAASTIAFGGSIMSYIILAAISPPVVKLLEFKGNKLKFAISLTLILANTASPVVARVAADLKYATTDVGRLAINSSLITELSCVLLFILCVGPRESMTKKWFLCFFLTGAVILANKYLAARINKRNRNQKHLTKAEMALFLSLIIAPGCINEMLGYNTMVSTFLFGIMFPREGKSARTLLHKLSYCVHTLVLPIFVAYTGFQFNGIYFKSVKYILLILVMVLSSLGAKAVGTLAACHYLKISLNEGNMLAFFMNLRGHSELVFLDYVIVYTDPGDLVLRNLLIITVVVNTLIAGPVVAFLVGKERDLFARKPMALELQDPDNELRMLAYLYGPRHVSAAVGLISALSGSQQAPISPYLMHLVELPEKHKSNLLYHQLEDGDEFSDEEDYGGNEALEINDAVDAFTTETGILIHQLKAVSPFASLYEDVCSAAEDLHSSIVILPFHKHQRIDGKMENSKEGIRTTNHKVLRHAPCSVGIVVDRGFPGVPQSLGSDQTVLHIATLFFGGPDDREALACSRLIATHPRINLTIIRFQQPTSSNEHDPDVGIDRNSLNGNNGILMSISCNGHTENQLDIAFLTDFYNRHVTSGQVGFVEKYVSNGAQTVAALKDMADTYSLFIVGIGGRGHSPMTTGMSDWEECPELGAVGDLLASADFNINGSVLVIQQHRNTKQDLLDD